MIDCVCSCNACARVFDNSGHNDSALMLDNTELVVEHLLEPIPVQGAVPVSVQGRLHEHDDFWLNELDASRFVKDNVTSGYKLPFLKLPWPA